MVDHEKQIKNKLLGRADQAPPPPIDLEGLLDSVILL